MRKAAAIERRRKELPEYEALCKSGYLIKVRACVLRVCEPRNACLPAHPPDSLGSSQQLTNPEESPPPNPIIIRNQPHSPLQ